MSDPLSTKEVTEYDSNEESQTSSTTKSPTSRTSAKTLYWIIKKFNPIKRQLVKEIGFGGLLELPLWNSISRIFSTWLLGQVDCIDFTIVLDAARRLQFTPQDVNKVFGIPCGHRDVLGPETQISDAAMVYIREQAGISMSKISLKDAEKIVLMDLSENSTRLQKDSFKMAFVIIAMGHLLSPSTKYDHVNIDFLGALRCTEEIGQYNWCAYVITCPLCKTSECTLKRTSSTRYRQTCSWTTLKLFPARYQ
ncbi:hypothetical protein BRADI_3g15448v3 [Brachypodium distachyon]|uniref:Aminotransferase-like plant mobile domain-containing protein n=1 Tax=Brachypodium distachyon TaxID=15368 RepID=A0A2K2CXB8_BRADI|nr:hypothetical protein BRADI_3g15448v3 [Brachypodium distachyon]